ncbi:MAG: DNA-binding protein [Thermoanaerobacterales bacterium]|jgi:predicted DNA-binding protein with PD1-like motif|nr:DNA-binding protein [Thermoanaerobacterales bacterium]
MEYKKFGNKYVMRIDKGEEIVDTLKKFCQDEKIKLGFVNGIGAVNKVRVGLFDTKSKQYNSAQLEGDYEITSLLGNISTKDGEVYLHLHINLSDANYNTRGGHLNSAVISGTGEIIIETIEGSVERQFSEEIGLNLYKF